MTRYAMLTDEPERLHRVYGTFTDWSVTPFDSAVGALIWERRLRGEGAIVLDSRGWRFGVVFTRVADNAQAPSRPEAVTGMSRAS